MNNVIGPYFYSSPGRENVGAKDITDFYETSDHHSRLLTGVVMKDDKLALYGSLIRASLLLIFIVGLSAGTFGLVVISRMVLQQAIANPAFPEHYDRRAETAGLRWGIGPV
jgi:hypothetical protein